MVELNPNVVFTAEDHKYINKLTGEQLVSVSTLVHHYSPPFDPEGAILEKCAAKKGVSAAALKAEWENTNKVACDYGHAVHTELEHYIDHRKIRPSPYVDFVKQFKKIKFKGKLQSETIVASLDYYLAGTIDLIELFPDDTINLYDFKTNKKLKKFNPFKNGPYGNRMMPPFSHLHDCNFNHYTLQLNTYAYLLEEMGYWVKSLTIFYINPETQTFEVHPVDFRRFDTEKLVKSAKDIAKSFPKH